MTATTIIRSGRLLDIDGHGAERADILVVGDTIKAVGPPGMEVPSDAVALDAADRLMHPGLINAHTHSHGNLSKGMGDRWTLELLLAAAPWISGNRQLEEKYLSTLIGAIEMLEKGCTAAYDLFFEFPAPSLDGLDAVARGYRDAGMRAVVAPMVADRTFYEAVPGLMDYLPPALQKDVEAMRLAPYETSIANLRAALKDWSHASDSVRLAVAPTIPMHCTDEFMVACRDLAREFGVGIHSHVSESKVQAVYAMKRYGKSPTAHLDELGLLGPDFVVAHGVWLDDDDMRRLADHGASVSHNPGSNMRLGNGIADSVRMLELGVNLAVGTDGASCSDNQNMYEAMRLASFASKVRCPDWQDWIRTEQVLTAATAGSARALGFEKLGKIEPGYKADIVFLDLSATNWLPLNDATNQIVHTEEGTAVDKVMVGGRIVVRDGRAVDVDKRRLMHQVEDVRARLAEVNAPNRRLYDRLEGVVGTFCPGLAHTPHHIQRYGHAHR